MTTSYDIVDVCCALAIGALAGGGVVALVAMALLRS
jgi:hypothetical protein